MHDLMTDEFVEELLRECVLAHVRGATNTNIIAAIEALNRTTEALGLTTPENTNV